MAVTVLFLGPLRDLEGAAERSFDAPLSWDRLLDAVQPGTAEQLLLDRGNVACAGRVLADKMALLAQDSDEVALLPPVSGG